MKFEDVKDILYNASNKLIPTPDIVLEIQGDLDRETRRGSVSYAPTALLDFLSQGIQKNTSLTEQTNDRRSIVYTELFVPLFNLAMNDILGFQEFVEKQHAEKGKITAELAPFMLPMLEQFKESLRKNLDAFSTFIKNPANKFLLTQSKDYPKVCPKIDLQKLSPVFNQTPSRSASPQSPVMQTPFRSAFEQPPVMPAQGNSPKPS